MKYLKATFWATFWTVAVIGGGYLFIAICEYVITTFGSGLFIIGLVSCFVFTVVFGAVVSPDRTTTRPPLK